MTTAAEPAATQLYHVCFAVPDLSAAMTELTELTGLDWGEPAEERLDDWDYSIVFSRQSPYVELISSASPGSPWTTAHPRFHPIGFWVDDLDNCVRRWAREGATVDFDGRDYDRRFAYFSAPRSGAGLEAVDVARRPAFLERWG